MTFCNSELSRHLEQTGNKLQLDILRKEVTSLTFKKKMEIDLLRKEVVPHLQRHGLILTAKYWTEQCIYKGTAVLSSDFGLVITQEISFI